MQDFRTINKSPTAAIASAVIRSFSLLGLLLGFVAMTYHLVGRATGDDGWGKRLNPTVLMATGAVLILVTLVALGITASAAVLIPARAKTDFVFAHMGTLTSPVGAIVLEVLLSPMAAAMAWLFGSLLLDASSGRTNVIMVGMSVLVFPLCILALLIRKVSIVSVASRQITSHLMTTPLIATSTRSLTEISQLEVVIDSTICGYVNGLNPFDKGGKLQLGGLCAEANQQQRMAFAHGLGTAVQIPVRSV